MLALTTAKYVGEILSQNPDENQASLAAASGVKLQHLVEAYGDGKTTEENVYKLYQELVVCHPAQEYQRSSGESRQRKVEHRLACINDGFVIQVRSDRRVKTLFKLLCNGDQAKFDGFEEGKKMVMITSVNGSVGGANRVGFAILTFIPEVDKHLRKRGFLPTERDALLAAYTEVSQQLPALAYNKSEKKLVENLEDVPAVDYVTFNYDGQLYILYVPLVHEVSFYNQKVVLEDRFRQQGLDYQAVARTLIEEVEKLRLFLKTEKPKMAASIDQDVEIIYRFFSRLMGKSVKDLLMAAAPANIESWPMHFKQRTCSQEEAIAEREHILLGENKKRFHKNDTGAKKKSKRTASTVKDICTIDQDLNEDLLQINQNFPDVDDPEDSFFVWISDPSLLQ